MEIRNVTMKELETALETVNTKFDGNIRFRFDPEFIGKTRDGGEKYKVRLTVKSSRGPGTKVSPSGRRVATACWHVHGEFYDALPSDALILAARHRISPGDYWNDWQEGSMFNARMASECCECD